MLLPSVPLSSELPQNSRASSLPAGYVDGSPAQWLKATCRAILDREDAMWNRLPLTRRIPADAQH